MLERKLFFSSSSEKSCSSLCARSCTDTAQFSLAYLIYSKLKQSMSKRKRESFTVEAPAANVDKKWIQMMKINFRSIFDLLARFLFKF